MTAPDPALEERAALSAAYRAESDPVTLRRAFAAMPYSIVLYEQTDSSGAPVFGWRVETQALPAGAWPVAFLVQEAAGWRAAATHRGLGGDVRRALATSLRLAGYGWVDLDALLAAYPVAGLPEEEAAS